MPVLRLAAAELSEIALVSMPRSELLVGASVSLGALLSKGTVGVLDGASLLASAVGASVGTSPRPTVGVEPVGTATSAVGGEVVGVDAVGTGFSAVGADAVGDDTVGTESPPSVVIIPPSQHPR